MSICRGLRGATTTEYNSREAILEATTELLRELVKANEILRDQIAAVWFTTTSDLNAEFPAVAARKMGWSGVALLCGHEMQIPDGTPSCIRVLVLWNTDKTLDELNHVYLRGAKNLLDRGMDS